MIGGALLYFGHTLSYFSVWEHHMSGVIVVGLALVWSFETSAASERLRSARTIAMVALVCLVLPTPYVLFDRELNDAQIELLRSFETKKRRTAEQAVQPSFFLVK